MVEHMRLFGYQTIGLKQIPLRFSIIIDQDMVFVGTVKIGAWLFSKKLRVKGIIHQQGKNHYVYFVHKKSRKDTTAVVYSLLHGDGMMSGYFGTTPKNDVFEILDQEFPSSTQVQRLKTLAKHITPQHHIGTAHLSISKLHHK